MKFIIQVESDNEGMVTHPELAVKSILRRIDQKVSDGSTGGTVFDLNGNTVGTWRLEVTA